MLIVFGVADDPKFLVRINQSLLTIMTESGTELLKTGWKNMVESIAMIWQARADSLALSPLKGTADLYRVDGQLTNT